MTTDPISKDIRWREVFGSIQDVKLFDGADGKEIFIEIRWEGERFSARYTISEYDFDFLTTVLDRVVCRLDEMLEEHGHPPYDIRGK